MLPASRVSDFLDFASRELDIAIEIHFMNITHYNLHTYSINK